MPADSVADRLASLKIFEAVPRQDLDWLVEHGELRIMEAGVVLSKAGDPMDEMCILIEGRTVLYVGNGAAARRFMEAPAGYVVGTLPFSRFQSAPAAVVVEDPVTALMVHRRHFDTLIREHVALAAALVHHMIDRSREYRTAQMNDDRLESLSRLAAGFAHELNNPAAAATRTARSLAALIDEESRAARQLAAARLTDDQLALVDELRSECSRMARPLSALETADREDEIGEWLARHDLDANLSPALARSDLTMAALERVAGALPHDGVGVAVRWIASGCAARDASRQIEIATGRISDLVGAVKGFTFMDREGVPEPVDIARGLADTIAMLEGKARTKSATLHLETAPDLPRVDGFGSQLNQVWEKLVDNAIDAVGDRGSVTITAAPRGDAVLVRVADDGPGIPEPIRQRIFDPFFTTKPVGRGTGMGLDIARRIVHLHRGEIEFTTQPGRTVFRVRLPAAGAGLAAGWH